jgi:hypothetical protein
LGGASSLTSTIAPLTSTNISANSKLTINVFYGIGVANITLDASPPTAEIATVAVNTTLPANGSTLTVGTTTYTFSTAHVTAPPGSGCTVYVSGQTNTASYLQAAISNGSVGTYLGGAPNNSYFSSWCTSTLGNSLVTAAVASHTITLTAKIPGTTGFTLSQSTSAPAANLTLTHTNGSDGITSGTSNPPTFAYWSGNNYVTPAQLAANIATAINTDPAINIPFFGRLIKATANTPTSGTVTITELFSIFGSPDTIAVLNFSAFTVGGNGTIPFGVQAAAQPNVYPAKYGSLTAASCASDFVVYPTGQAGGGSASTIIAYNNLYVGSGTGSCGATDPTVYWAYNTGAGYTVTTSPIISQDGAQVAFMQSNGTAASLVILKWLAGSTNSVSSPGAITLASGSAYSSCTAPCMVSIPFNDGHNDSISAPFYDYASDGALYVGDDSGLLHKFTGVFNGAPAEVTTSGWPAVLGGSVKVSSPVYDPVSGYVFVGDLSGTLYSVGSGNAGTTSGSKHGSLKVGDAIADGPFVDSNAESVYAFVTTNGSGNNAVYQFSAAFTASSSSSAAIGTGTPGYYLYSGDFDNVYYSSSSYTGNLYVVGNTGATTGGTLYRVPVTSSLLGTPVSAVTSLTASGAYPWPSPLTEYYNASESADFVFFSVNRGNEAGCTNTAGNGCILSYNISGATPVLSGGQDLATPTGSGCWATGGIVIDNDATTTGASQIYFVNLNGTQAGGPSGATSSNCAGSAGPILDAVQASQANP